MYSFLLLKKLTAPEFIPNLAITKASSCDNLSAVTLFHESRWSLNTEILSASVRGKMDGRNCNFGEADGGAGGVEMLKLPYDY
jgi:hypothetical protein